MLHTALSIKVSYGCLFQDFRTCQRNADKEISNAVALVRELWRRVAESQDEEDINWKKVLCNLDNIENHLKGLVSRLKDSANESDLVLDK